MTDKLFDSIVTIVTAIIGVAILAVIVSKNAQTAQVIQAGSQGLATALQAAEAPVTGTGAMGITGGQIPLPD